jgi:phenylacetate-coenzyme A ligase PaaK-like adenylate-forming protein
MTALRAKVVAKLRARRLEKRIAPLEQLMSTVGADQVEEWQLRRLNTQWLRIVAKIPYYAERLRGNEIPRQFESLQEFQDTVPLTSRELLQEELTARLDRSRPPAQYRATGGSTAQPLRFPVWSSEAEVAGTAAWLARRWVGISPADRLFLLWGHSHLFGTGLRGWAKRRHRQLADWLLGYRRWSAYDMSQRSLRTAGDSLLQFKPDYLMGYSVALERLADANADRQAEFAALRMKAVIATAERFPRPESRTTVEQVFGCRVLMEYGTVETGVLAQETAVDFYQTMWHNFLIEALPNQVSPGHYDVVVTGLYPRCLPLVRYCLGDQITIAEPTRSILKFRKVAGRCNDTLVLTSGKVIHSEAFAHVIRDLRGIRGYQVVQRGNDCFQLRLRTQEMLTPIERDEIFRRLVKIDIVFQEMELCEVRELEKSIAGKTPSVVLYQQK